MQADQAFLTASRALATLPDRFIVHRNKEPVSLARPAQAGPHGQSQNQLPLLDALRTCAKLNASGIGFSVPDGYVVVDFDSAIDAHGNIEAWALAVLSKIPDTLVEYSPSGHGLHAYLKLTPAAHDFVMGIDKATSISNGKVEFLRSGFYSTITGNKHPRYPDAIAELDALSAQQLFDRIKQTARSLPSTIPVETFDAAIYKATEDDIARWREQIRSGAALHQPTFQYAWWCAYNHRDKYETECELHELYNQCELKDGRWEDRKRKINAIVARCFRKAIEYHKKVEELRLAMAQLSEEGNARYCAEHNSKNIIYTNAMGWMTYGGKVYESITEYQAREELFQTYMKRLIELYEHAAHSDTKASALIHKHTMSCRTNKTRTAIEMMARGFMLGDYADYDQDTTVLNCQNGVIDFRTGLLLRHDPSFKMVNMANVSYKPKGATPHWDKFLDELTCFDTELKEYLLRCLGYSLTGETSEQKFFVLYGGGGNGKTTLTNVMRDLIGISTHPIDGASLRYKRYFATLRSEAILAGERGGDTGNDLAAVAKARMVVASEIGDRRIKDERLKAMVGGDTMQVRFLFREYFEITPHFKLWLQTNQRPRVRGNDEGIWRRAVMIPCLGDFRANPDRFLGDKLFSEREAIFHQLVQYAIQWYRNRLPEPPAVVAQETASWREETDAVARYLRECVERRDGAKTSNGQIWGHWTKWCEEQNEKPGTANDFFKRLRTSGWEPRKLSFGGDSKRGYDSMHIINDDVEY